MAHFRAENRHRMGTNFSVLGSKIMLGVRGAGGLGWGSCTDESAVLGWGKAV